MKIKETINEQDNFGNDVQRVVERNTPDILPAIPPDVVTTQPYVPLPKDEPISGKLYYIRFNTTRIIEIDVPKNLTIGGWGIIIEKVYKPTPETLKVVFSIQTGVSQKEAILRNLI